MSSTTTRNKIGDKDIKWWDGITNTFTRETSTGGLLTLNKIGNNVYVAEAYGDGVVSETALITAVSNIGTVRKRNLILSAGTWSITNDLTIPSNITLTILPGAILDIATTKTLTINGTISAGPYQIFSWSGTGAITLSSSPMSVFPIQWWGGLTGTGNDNSDIITQAQAGLATNARQALYFSSDGVWRIASALTFANAINWQGDGIDASAIYVDVGANVALTVDSNTETIGVKIEGIEFVGPANCCTNALKLVACDWTRLDVKFALGCTDYAFNSNGCIFLEGKINIYNGAYGANCAKGILLDSVVAPHPAAGWANNNADLRIHINSCTSIGIRIEGGGSWKLSGSVENCDPPLEVDGSQLVEISNFHMEGTGSDPITFTDVESITLNGWFGYLNSAPLEFINCTNVVLHNFEHLPAVTIGAGCKGFVVIGSRYGGAWTDLAADTQYVGPNGFNNNDLDIASPSPGQNPRNLLTNTLCNRWTAAGDPENWGTAGNITYTKCGTGEVDTTNHFTTYCIKVTVDTTSAYPDIAIDTTARQNLMGNYCNLTAWAKIPTGQTFTSYPYIGVYPSIPDWAATTDYVPGDMVRDTGHGTFYFLCITGGTSDGTEPTWDETIKATTTETGGVVWRATYNGAYSSYVNTPMVAGDVGGDWKQLRSECFVPKNATDLTAFLFVPLQSDDSDGTVYVSEPCLMTGRLGARGVHPGDYDPIISKLEFTEISDPANPVASGAYLFVHDNGGKTEICARFQTGAVVVIASEP